MALAMPTDSVASRSSWDGPSKQKLPFVRQRATLPSLDQDGQRQTMKERYAGTGAPAHTARRGQIQLVSRGSPTLHPSSMTSKLCAGELCSA